jgi:hypothetical protein
VESLDVVSISYVTQLGRYGTMMAATLETADSDVLANVKPLHSGHGIELVFFHSN